jgi:hypothetical protein
MRKEAASLAAFYFLGVNPRGRSLDVFLSEIPLTPDILSLGNRAPN